MATIIPLQNPWLEAARNIIEPAQEQRYLDEQARAQERLRQKQLLKVGLGAAAGAGLGLLAAPALGLGATQVGSSLVGGVATPIMGTSTLGYATGALGGAALGANIAQGAESGDLAGPLGMAAGVVGQALTSSEERKVYGYNPSREEKAAFAQAALKAGTNLGALQKLAAEQGISVPDALNRAQQSAMLAANQQEVSQAGLIAGAQTKARLEQEAFAAQLDDLDRYGYVSQPDDAAIAQVQKEWDSVHADISQGFANPVELLRKTNELRGRMATAVQGKKVPKGPRVNYLGQEHPVGTAWTDEENGLVLRAAMDAKGNPQVEKVGDAIKKPKPVRIDMGGGNIFESSNDAGVLPDGRTWKRNADGSVEVSKPDQTPRQKLIESLAVDKDGVARGTDEIADILGAVDSAEQVLEDRKTFAQEIVTFAQTPGPVPPEAAAAIADRAVTLYGENPPMKVRDSVAIIDQRAKQTVEAMKQAAVPPAPPPAPPGTAAAAEQTGRSAAKAVKAVPAAAAQAAKGAATAVGKTGQRAGMFGVGFAEELLGINPATPEGAQAARFAQIQKQNIEAGIDEPVVVLRPDGSIVQVIKGTLTPERMAEFKQNGFTIPGLD